MLAWIIAILFAAAVIAAISAIMYRILPLKEIIISMVERQKVLIYFVLCYPLLYLIFLLLFGNSIHVPNTKYHIPSAFVFLSGHIALAILAIIAAMHLEKHSKNHLIFIITNSIAGLAYTTITLVLLQMGWHNS